REPYRVSPPGARTIHLRTERSVVAAIHSWYLPSSLARSRPGRDVCCRLHESTTSVRDQGQVCEISDLCDGSPDRDGFADAGQGDAVPDVKHLGARPGRPVAGKEKARGPRGPRASPTGWLLERIPRGRVDRLGLDHVEDRPDVDRAHLQLLRQLLR